MSLVAYLLVTAGLELCPRGSGPLRTLDLPGGAQVTGSGSTQRGDTTWYGWTGGECTAWIRTRGLVRLSDDERTLHLSPGAQLVVHVQTGTLREYRLADTAGVLSETLTDSGTPVSVGPAERDWIAMAIGELARRAGIAPAQRSNRLLTAGGLDAVLAEAARVPREEVRAEYLIVPLLAPATAAGERTRYIEQASLLLGTSRPLAHFLMSVPSEWRRDQAVMRTVLMASARVEPDDDAVSVLRLVVPAGAVPSPLAPVVRAIIATLQSEERRRELLALYFR